MRRTTLSSRANPVSTAASGDNDLGKCSDDVRGSDEEWDRLVDHGSVNCRAWVCQERLLAPRVVHFADGQVFWEYRELKASEKFHNGIPKRYETSVERPLVRAELATDNPRRLLEIWNSTVATSSASDLTYTSDKLTAVSALAGQVSAYRPTAGQYLAGVWKDQLLVQFRWSASNYKDPPMEYRAPSWSWACIDGPIWPRFDWSGYGIHGSKYGSKAMIKSVDFSIKIDEDAYGSAKSGILQLSGPLLKVKFMPKAEDKPIERNDGTYETNEAKHAHLESLMLQTNTDYKLGNITTVAISDGIRPDAVRLTMDPSNGVMSTDESG